MEITGGGKNEAALRDIQFDREPVEENAQNAVQIVAVRHLQCRCAEKRIPCARRKAFLSNHGRGGRLQDCGFGLACSSALLTVATQHLLCDRLGDRLDDVLVLSCNVCPLLERRMTGTLEVAGSLSNR